LNTTSVRAAEKTALYCPACKKKLNRSGNAYICQSCGSSFPVVNDIPSLVMHRESMDSFARGEFESLFQMEQKHFWHTGRREIILDVIKRNIPDWQRCRMLEVGCGNGSVTAFLKHNGIQIEGGDLYSEGLAYCRQQLDSVPLYQLDVLALPFRDEFDLIGMFDVLEHIDDDDRALSEIGSALKPGGWLLITVPAYRFLWSYFDKLSKHKRRYSREEVIDKLEQAGFTIKKVSYFMFFLFPVLAAARMIGNRTRRQEGKRQGLDGSLETKTIPVLNDIFLGLLRFEKYLMRRFNLPFGASIIILAERKT